MQRSPKVQLSKCAMRCGNHVKRPGAIVCGINCAIAYSKRQQERTEIRKSKAIRKEYRKAKNKLKTRSEWEAEAKSAIQRYVRLRDKEDGCISCDKPSTWQGQWHGSHFRQSGNVSATRFNLWNINKACSICNRHQGGAPIPYRIKLIDKIGIEKVSWLESQNHVVKYSIEYLQRIKKIFNKKARKLRLLNT